MVRRTKADALVTRNSLLDAAEHLFQAHGVSRTSLNDIANTAGTTRGAIYWHFKDKAALYNAMKERVTMPMEGALACAAGKAEAADNPLLSLRDSMMNALKQTATDEQTRRVFEVATHKVEYVSEMQAVRDRHLQVRNQCMAMTEKALREVVRREDIKLPMPLPTAALGLHVILDGLIHPTRIEEVVAAVNQEMDGFILRKGEEAVYKSGQPPMNPEVARMLGRLHFRHSYSQNVLDHSIEVAQLAGLMAAELGEDSSQARRSGLLHDIGKAMSHEVEGPHAIVGADFLKRHGETPVIVNAVASHHDEVPHETIFGILVAASDAISASRPGSRSESMTTYLQRLENLERIALDFEGVERAFAIQAGRELRVVVKPESVDDRESLRLARDIARRIEDQLLYPGQIRITVIRETRCVEYAK